MSPSIAAAVSYSREASVAAAPDERRLPRGRSRFGQGDVPCCVSCALAAAMEILHPTWPPLAALFHYHVSRNDDRAGDAHGFLQLEAAILTLTGKGICAHALHPLSITPANVTARPSAVAYRDGARRVLGREGFWFRYRALAGGSRVGLIRQRIREGAPVVIGLRLPVGYPRAFLDPRSEWRDPASPPASSDHHCVLVDGYSDARLALRIQDSRDVPGADAGTWWLGYRVADSPVVREAFTLF